MGNPILFSKAPSVDQPSGWFRISQRKAKIKRGVRRQAEAYRTLFRVALVSDNQPMFHFVVDII